MFLNFSTIVRGDASTNVLSANQPKSISPPNSPQIGGHQLKAYRQKNKSSF